MKIFGLAGWSGSGKTTLVAKLLPELRRRGLSVSTVKHAHHAFDIDQPGKDSYTHRAAGAVEVMIGSANRWALMHELRGAAEPGVEELLAHMSEVDLVLIEGFKAHAHDKLEIYRADSDKPLLCLEDPRVVALASDLPAAVLAQRGVAVPVLDIDDAGAIADFIVRHLALARPQRGVA
ncbi:MAG TPA: molybdopterin-guanine dinucleotide biosynthesis protein B [Alphaproteobacteria bacterium]|nr:molybdopterin-guanine dinucleotide biosynthesis protein B [Alphaproteobacteria bacterium]